MVKSHVNCAVWSKEIATHVFCKCDMLPGCWYLKNGNASKCRSWRPRFTELHLETGEIVAEYYDGAKEPISVVARCSDGCRYAVASSHVMQARVASWTCRHYRYAENEVQFDRQTWFGTPIKIVVMEENLI